MSARKPHRSNPRQTNRRRAAKKPAAASAHEQKRFMDYYNALDFDAAQSYAETLTQHYPKDAFGWKVLGSCLHKNGHIEKSQKTLGRALALDAADAQAQHLMARAWYDLGEPGEALAFAHEAVRLEPEFAQGHFTLAEILSESDRDDDALTHARRAEALGHEKDACLFMCGHLHAKRRRYRKAFENVQQLVERNPNNPFAQNEIANLYKDLGRFDEAESSYRKALEINPEFDTAFSNLLICMHYNPAADAQQIADTIGQWEHYFPSQQSRYEHMPDPARADDIIRIGMVSPGFRMHPVGQMILTGLERLQPGFELYFYSTNNAEDALTRRLKTIATSWNLVRHLDPDALAKRIHDDGVDILLDLSGYGEGSRLRTTSRKPAPLIVKWVGGLINTMGLSAFDYLISDHHETPEGVDDWYTEKLIRLPDDYICYLPAPDAPPITALPAISNSHITLGCFNNPAKINPVLLGEWAKLMHELPDSRLLLKSGQYDSPEYCERLRAIMAEHGIHAERLILEGPSDHRDLMAAYNRVDIALDTWPYSGGLTTCEAFMMGVPVVTMPGPTFAGRHSATHLINAGMPELVTHSWDDYRQRVIELASDIPNLSVIRACLRQFLTQSAVCDAKTFGKNFSTAMRAIWQRHCEGLPAKPVDFDEQHDVIFRSDDYAWQTTQKKYVENPKKPDKIFLIGFPKSGTTTIQKALEASGISTAHWRVDEGFCGKLMYDGHHKHGDPFHYLANYDGVTQADVCIPDLSMNYWPNLDFGIISEVRELHPECLFILNYRTPKDIADSIMRWGDLHERMMRSKIPGLDPNGEPKRNLVDWIESHYTNCRDYFGDDPNFLELDISDPHAAGILGARLGFDVKWWGKANSNTGQAISGEVCIPDTPHMSEEELALFQKSLSDTTTYFEFGTGGSTVLAVNNGLTVEGVETDQRWVNALKTKLGARCHVEWCDIGPTGDWGIPVNSKHQETYPAFSRSILEADQEYDLVLVDGRFRTACILMSIKKAISQQKAMKIFIHDFWNRSEYHIALLFLQHIASAKTAGLFKPRDNIDLDHLEKIYWKYAFDTR